MRSLVASVWHDLAWWLDYESKNDDYLVRIVRSLKGHQREMYELYRERGSSIAQSLDALGFTLVGASWSFPTSQRPSSWPPRRMPSTKRRLGSHIT